MTLILVKHAMPQIDIAIPSKDWLLSESGRRSCLVLADRLRRYGASRIFSSHEPKALETAQIVSGRLLIPMEPLDGLQENDRTGFPFLQPDPWKEAFRRYFLAPDQRTIGLETPNEARARFQAAVDLALTGNQVGSTIILAHGTVISLFVACRTGIPAFELWEGLRLPSFVVINELDYSVVELVREIG